MVLILHFSYGTMNSGKGNAAISLAHSLKTIGKQVSFYKPMDERDGSKITSRIAKEEYHIEAIAWTDCRFKIQPHQIIIIDEAQFLTATQVGTLDIYAHDISIFGEHDIYCFGLLTDFKRQLFTGSKNLIEIADEIHKIQNVVYCKCGADANINSRWIGDNIQTTGATVEFGDVESTDSIYYKPICAICYYEALE